MDNRQAEGQVVRFISRTANVLGIISFLFIIIPALLAFVTRNLILCALSGLAIAIGLILHNNRKKFARNCLFHFLNLTASNKCYKLCKKEIIYEFIDRTHMSLKKNFSAKVLHSGFNYISDKFKWTGDKPLIVKSADPIHYCARMLDSKFGLDRYLLEVNGGRRYSVGDKVEMTSVIENIVDDKMKSSLHLSSGVYEKTDLLVLKVLFNPGLPPKNARRVEYIHYHDDDHLKSEDIAPYLENGKICLKWEIEKPFYGGKYVIEWEF